MTLLARWAGSAIERGQALERLAESEALLRGIADSLPDSYLYEYTLDSTGQAHFLHLSSGVQRLHNVSREAALADASLVLSQIAAEQRAEFQLAEEVSRRSMSDFSMDLRVHPADGDSRWLRLHSQPRQQPDGKIVWDGLATDITDQHLYESEINRLAQAMEQNPTAVLIINASGGLEYLNSAYTQVTGYQFGEVYGKSLRELLSSEISEAEFAPIHAQVAAGKPWHGVLSNRHKNGKLFWEEITASAVHDQSGLLTHFLYTRQDVTEREKMLQEIDLGARVLSVSNEGVMVSDAQNRIVSVNPAFTRITGYSAEEMRPDVKHSG